MAEEDDKGIDVDFHVTPNGEGCVLTLIVAGIDGGEPSEVAIELGREARFNLAEGLLSPAGSGYMRRVGKVS
jgi:hypothetical protein